MTKRKAKDDDEKIWGVPKALIARAFMVLFGLGGFGALGTVSLGNRDMVNNYHESVQKHWRDEDRKLAAIAKALHVKFEDND